MKALFILVFAVILAFESFAQEAFVQAVVENTYPLEFVKGNRAAAILDEAIDESQFTMIGEVHGLAEVQAVSTRLYSIGSAKGYNAMVIETDPYCAAKVAQLATAPEGEALEFARKYPMAIPFFHSEEGMDMARSIMASGGTMWGVDQVFVVAPRYLFAKLAKVAESSEANELAAQYAERAHETFNAAMSSGNPGDVILQQLTDSEFDKLRETFAGQPSAIEMIDQIQLSRDIYEHWYNGEYYMNNKVRSDLMKRLFLERFRNASDNEDVPRVMFKLGSNHAVRGLTSTYIYDLGNTVTELAAVNGTSSTHIRLTGARGTFYNMLSGKQEFDSTEDWHQWLQDALLGPVEDGETDYLLIDFRPLRHLPMKSVDAELRDLVFGWDFWIIIRNANAISPIGQ